MKIAILVPNNFTHLIKEFAISLVQLQANFYAWQKAKGRDDELSVLFQGGLHVDRMRNKLVEAALAEGTDLLIFLDSDQTFPPNAIQMFVEDFEDNPEVEAVTGIYTWKEPPYLPHIYRTYNEETKKFMIAGGFPLDELFEVEGAAAGCLAVRRSVFERVEKPWFSFGIWEDSLPLGEDLYFCFKAKPKMVCDPRISCGHYRSAMVGLQDYIKSNGLKVAEAKHIEITQEELDAVAEKHTSRIGVQEPEIT